MVFTGPSRRSFLGGLCGAAALSLSFGTRAWCADAPQISSEKLTDRIYVFEKDGGNVAVILSPDGLFMVDGGLPDNAGSLAASIATVSSKPVSTLFDTHWHFDHTGSNVYLGQKGAKIIAHDNTRDRLSSKQTMEALNRTFDPLPPAGVPGVTFHEPGAITFGVEKVQYTPVPPAHTDGDTFVFLPEANVLHTGDLLFNGIYPVIDYSSKGWIGGMAVAADQILTVCDSHTRIIPGHGPLASKTDLQAFRDMVRTVQNRLETMAKAGKPVEEVIAAAPTKDFDARWSGGFLKPDVFTRIAYTSILRHTAAQP